MIFFTSHSLINHFLSYTHTHIHITQDHCWVLADNAALSFPDVIDSRTFGPLPVSNIIGRVMYAARSETDHGPIENSEAGMESDAPVLEAELDLENLCGRGDDDEKGGEKGV